MIKNKLLKICLLLLISYLYYIPSVNAASDFVFCKGGTLTVFKVLGGVIMIIKIVVPLLLIILGVIDMSKAVMSDDEKAITKSVNLLVKRIVAGVVIFFIPTIIKFAFSLVSNTDDLDNSDLNKCTNCMLDVTKCS